MAIIGPATRTGNSQGQYAQIRITTASVAASGTSDTIQIDTGISVGFIRQVSSLCSSLDITINTYDASAAAAANLISSTNITGASAPVQDSITNVDSVFYLENKTIYIEVVNNDTSNATGTITLTLGLEEGR